MKFSQTTFRKSFIVIGLFTAFSVSQAEETKAFDYTKASTNYVDNTTTGGDLFSKGYYLGGAIGQSDASSFCGGASGCENNDTAWKLFGGYKLLEKVSVEGAYLNLGDIRKDGQSSDVQGYGGYAVGALPVTEKFEALAKVGGVYWKSDNSDGNESGFSLAYGVGAKMTLNETTKLRAEWEKVTDVETSDTDKSDISMLTIGVELSTF